MKGSPCPLLIAPLFLLVILWADSWCTPARGEEPRGVTSVEEDLRDFRPVRKAVRVTREGWGVSAREGFRQDSRLGPEWRDLDGWVLEDSLYVDFLLRPGGNSGVMFDHDTGEIVAMDDGTALTPNALAAVEKAPSRFRALLSYRLSELGSDDQERWAAIVNAAEDPYIDEIVFSIANLSALFLSSGYAYPELVTLNAELVYEFDADLSYAEVVDYGTSADDDYYSTVRYWKIDPDTNTVLVEMPEDIYYWYLVHPKLTDEIPAFIDPDIEEKKPRHCNNIADPPAGVFWRDFLYNHADDGYPLLRDMLSECTGIFDYTNYSNPGMATRKLTDWILQSLDFTSDWERPHQPVRIYRKHWGRCGEHQDITAAVSRAALIPCRGISSISTDHVWNEFWDESWVQWEPVNNSFNNPLIYENGWGKVFASVFGWRSDGVWHSVTDRYSEGLCSITVRVEDSLGRPVDGADIYLYIHSGVYTRDNCGQTNNAGEYTFLCGEDHCIYARIVSAIGRDPEDPYGFLTLVENTEDGADYTFLSSLDGTLPEVHYTEISVPADTLNDFRLDVSYSVAGHHASGHLLFDDIADAESDTSLGLEEQEGGDLSFFMTNSYNCRRAAMDSSFSAFNVIPGSGSGAVSFSVPGESDWYAFLNNDDRLNNPQHASFSAALYSYTETGVDGGEEGIPPEPGPATRLRQNCPNPFNPHTTVRFDLENPCRAGIEVYDVTGRLVDVIADGRYAAGAHAVFWSGTDRSGKTLPSGVYFCRLEVDGKVISTKKMLLLR